MNIFTLSTSVTRYAGSLSEMLPHFLVIAVVVAIIIIALNIYNKFHK